MDPSVVLDLTNMSVFLSHREKYGRAQNKFQLSTRLAQFKKLYYEDSEKHAAEISSILLWIAAKHPYVFEIEDWKITLPRAINIWDFKTPLEKRPIAPIKILNFSSSWERVNEAIPDGVILPLLGSPLCSLGLQALCGYISPFTLRCIHGYTNCRGTRQCTLKLALGLQIDVRSLIEELHKERNDTWHSDEYKFEKLSLHLQCGELQSKNLSPLPDTETTLYLSEVNDDNVEWVVQIVTALKPKEKYLPRSRGNFDFSGLLFPHSNLTYVGVESIVRRLSEAGIKFAKFAVSSPNIPITHTLEADNDWKCSFECGCRNWSHVFATWVMDKFDIWFVYFTDEIGMNFRHFSTYDIWGDESLDGEDPWW